MGMPSVSTVRNTVCQVIDSTGTWTAVIGQSDPVVVIPQVLFRTVTYTEVIYGFTELDEVKTVLDDLPVWQYLLHSSLPKEKTGSNVSQHV